MQAQDVWLWVQAVDAMCLRFLLGDKEITQAMVLAGYYEQFTFGATQRVKVRLVCTWCVARAGWLASLGRGPRVCSGWGPAPTPTHSICLFISPLSNRVHQLLGPRLHQCVCVCLCRPLCWTSCPS